MSTKSRIGALTAATGVALALSGLLAGSASALAYDGQDPEASGCANTAITAEQHSLTSGSGAVVGVVQLRYSTACRTVWGRVEAYSSAWATGGVSVFRNSDGMGESWPTGTGSPTAPLSWSSANGAYTAYTPMLNDANVTSYAAGCVYDPAAGGYEDCWNTASY